MTLRALIVDDEPPARDRLRRLLATEPDVEIVGECGDGPSAVEAITRDAPDVVFLDIQMPGLDGFGVLAALPAGQLPVVIFTTAWDQHAVRAFDAHALDYVLKPCQPARLRQAVERARTHLAARDAGAGTRNLLELLAAHTAATRPAPQAWLTRFSIRNGERLTFLRTGEVDCIESAGNYVVLHSGKQEHILRETLTSLETQLDPTRFLRISRSCIVNLESIRELQPLFKGEHVVILKSGRKITMSRGLREVEKALRFGPVE